MPPACRVELTSQLPAQPWTEWAGWVANRTLSLFPELDGSNAEATDPSAPQHDGEDEVLVDVAVPRPLDDLFTYRAPADLRDRLTVGARVLVPFGSRPLLAIVMGPLRPRAEGDTRSYKAVLALADDQKVLDAELIGFLRALATYYLAPLGEVLALALPALERQAVSRLRAAGLEAPGARVAPSATQRFVRALEVLDKPRLGPKAAAVLEEIRKQGEVALRTLVEQHPRAAEHVRTLATRGLVAVDVRPIEQPFFRDAAARDLPPALSPAQDTARQAIGEALEHGQSAAFLLYGVTGSGKTEVYLRAIDKALALGRGALVLVPEIALTPQLLARFRARFGDEVALVHSALSRDLRHRMGRTLREGTVRVAIGARSALFAPVPNLGLVIVDEEHDPSFKQEEGVRYHARDGAMLRAHRAGAVVILGSATPSLETVALVRAGKVTELRLRERARNRPLPTIEVIDLRKVGPGPSGHPLLSLPLHRAIERTLAAREQVILFLNRRGFAPAVVCLGCGELRRCPRCDVALTWHRVPSQAIARDGQSRTLPPGLRCHHCDHVEPLPERCPKCAKPGLSLEGAGTERLETILAEAFPNARVGRLDRDVASGLMVEQILAKMRSRELDILLGTQMVTKGHDLPDVTMVGVLLADSALSMPDFRAGERTFQQLVQVAGRAGRGEVPGAVIIQTRSPEHPAIEHALTHDVDTFLARELEDRRELGHPPFVRLVLVRLEGPDEDRTGAAATRLADQARNTDVVANGQVEVLGPMPAPLPKLRDRFRLRVLLRGPRGPVRVAAQAIRRILPTLSRDVRAVIDVDPVSMM